MPSLMIRERRNPGSSVVTAVQLVRVRYDPAKKRSAQDILGSFSPYAVSVPTALLEKLTAAERAEVDVWLAERQAKNQAQSRRYAARRLAEYVDEIVAVLEGDDAELRQHTLGEVDRTGLPGKLDCLLRALHGAGVKMKVRVPTARG